MERHQRRRHRRNKWAGKTFNSRVGGKTRKASLVFDSLYFMLVIFTVAALLRVINDLVCNKLLAQDVCHTGIMVIILYIFPFQSDGRGECRTDLHLKKDFPPSYTRRQVNWFRMWSGANQFLGYALQKDAHKTALCSAVAIVWEKKERKSEGCVCHHNHRKWDFRL